MVTNNLNPLQESQNPPSRKESKDSDTDSDSDSDQSDGSDSDTDNEKEKIAFNFQQAKHPESDSDKSDDEPVRIIRGAAPPQFQSGDYEEELLNKSSTSQISPNKPGKKLNNRDIRQQKQAEFFEAKAESARLRRETDVQLPRHEKTLTLDDLQGNSQLKHPKFYNTQKYFRHSNVKRCELTLSGCFLMWINLYLSMQGLQNGMVRKQFKNS